MDLQHSNNKKFMLLEFAKGHCFWILWTQDCVDFVPFYSINSLYMAHNEAKWFKKILFSNFLCWRGPIKSVLFIHQYVCLSARLWHISRKMYFVDFFFVVVVFCFLREDILPYILKSEKTEFGKLNLLSVYLVKQDRFGSKAEYFTF